MNARITSMKDGKMESIVSSCETITPAMAANWLRRNIGNRTIISRIVRQYAKDIEEGNWQVNGETIKFSSAGDLIDGQHRLSAIVHTGKPVRMLVVRGLPEEAFHSIDIGAKRTGGQILAIAGVKNAALISAACRWIYLLETGAASSGLSISPPVLFEVLERHPLVTHFSSRLASGKTLKALLTSAQMAVFVLAAEKYGQDLIDNFLSRLESGEGLAKGDPAYELRERMISSKTRVARLPASAAVALTIKAVRAHVLCKPVAILRWSANEQMPEI